MIVIAIIGILAAIAIPNFISYRKRAYDKAAQTDLHSLNTSVLAYYAEGDKSTVALTLTDAVSSGFRQSSGVTVGLTSANQDSWTLTAKHANGDTTYSILADQTLSQG